MEQVIQTILCMKKKVPPAAEWGAGGKSAEVGVRNQSRGYHGGSGEKEDGTLNSDVGNRGKSAKGGKMDKMW